MGYDQHTHHDLRDHLPDPTIEPRVDHEKLQPILDLILSNFREARAFIISDNDEVLEDSIELHAQAFVQALGKETIQQVMVEFSQSPKSQDYQAEVQQILQAEDNDQLVIAFTKFIREVRGTHNVVKLLEKIWTKYGFSQEIYQQWNKAIRQDPDSVRDLRLVDEQLPAIWSQLYRENYPVVAVLTARYDETAAVTSQELQAKNLTARGQDIPVVTMPSSLEDRQVAHFKFLQLRELRRMLSRAGLNQPIIFVDDSASTIMYLQEHAVDDLLIPLKMSGGWRENGTEKQMETVSWEDLLSYIRQKVEAKPMVTR